MTRRPAYSFIESDQEDSKKAYCTTCEESTGRLNRLVPHYVNDILDDKFKACSYCGELYPIYDIKFVSEYEPKGFISDNPFDSGTKVVAVNTHRNIKKQRHGLRPIDNDIEIPKLAGEEDTELESMLKDRPGILLNLNDDDIGDTY